LKASLNKRIEFYREEVIRWIYEKMTTNVNDLYKNILTTIDKIKEKQMTSEGVVAQEIFIRKIRKEL
jgi:hypothetical protein